MAQSTSSAEPEKLFRYSDFGTRLDHELVSESYRLAARLQHFEAKCTEPGYQVSVGHLADALRSYGSQGESTNGWVRQVGKDFQMADQIWSGARFLPGALVGGTWALPGGALGMDSIVTLRSLLAVPDWLEKSISQNIDTLLTDGAELIDWFNDFRDWAAIPAALALDYTIQDGKVIISGSRFLKKFVGLSSYLTRIRPKNLPRHRARFGTAVSLLSLLPQWLRDVREYRDEGAARLMSALAVDGALKSVISVIAGAGGSWLGGTLVLALLGASATAPAVVVGGVVGGVILCRVGDEVFDWLDESGIRDEAIDTVTPVIAPVVDEIVTTGRQTAKAVDDALSSAIEAIQNVSLPQLAPT